MPYVDKPTAEKLDSDELSSETAGQLGYVLAKRVKAGAPQEALQEVVDAFVARRIEMMGGELRYQIICEVVGTLASLQQDAWDHECFEQSDTIADMFDTFWKNTARPYEDGVKAKNGTFSWTD